MQITMQITSPPRCAVFDRILCAVDGSEQSLEAVRQACALRAPDGRVELDSVFEPPATYYSPYGSPLVVSEAEKLALERLNEMQAAFPEASAHLLHGTTVGRLLERIRECEATLVAVGSTNRSRAVGIVRGSVASAMLHLAPTAVLVARAPVEPEAFPGTVVAGFDGSPAAARALDVARHVAAEHRSALRVVVAGPAQIDFPELADVDVERDERAPVEALLGAGLEADLLVLGSRGLRGVRALGSVSERVGHQAACSVLVVR